MLTITDNIEEYTQDFEEHWDRYVKAIGDVITQNAAETAINIESMLNLAPNRDEPITVAVNHIETDAEIGSEIVAQGKSVIFAEFGAGRDTGLRIDVDHIRNLSYQGVNVYPGSWSSTEGTGEYAKTGSWHHDFGGNRVEWFNTVKPIGAFTSWAAAYKATGLSFLDTLRWWTI